MRWRRNPRPHEEPTTGPMAATFDVELVAAEITSTLVLLDCIAIDGPAPGWPFMLPLVRPDDYSVIDATLTLLRWAARGDRVGLSTIAGRDGAPTRVRLVSGRYRLELIAVGDGDELGR